MDEVLLKRIVGLLTLAVVAFLLSWLLPRPGLDELSENQVKIVTLELAESEAGHSQGSEVPTAVSIDVETRHEGDDEVKARAIEEATSDTDIDGDKEVVAPTEKRTDLPKPARKQERPPVAAETPAPTAPETVKPEPIEEGVFQVQAGAFSQLDSARSMLARVSLQGLDCIISPSESAGGSLYRIRCGPYSSRMQADKAVSALKRDQIVAQVISVQP